MFRSITKEIDQFEHDKEMNISQKTKRIGLSNKIMSLRRDHITSIRYEVADANLKNPYSKQLNKLPTAVSKIMLAIYLN